LISVGNIIRKKHHKDQLISVGIHHTKRAS